MTRGLTTAALCATLTGAVSCGDSTGPPALGSIEVAPGAATMLVAEARQFVANARSLGGGIVTGVSISWRSTAGIIATVSPGGLVTGVNAGDVLIIASVGALSDTSSVTVIPVTTPPAPVATVDVQPVDSLNIETGASATLQAIPRSVTGAALANRVIVWSSADPTTVEITSDGAITGVKPGRVTISATSEGKTGTTLAISVQPSRDFSISDAHITQAVQPADQSMPIVQGNHAVINVLLTATPIKTFPMDVMLRVTEAGGALWYADTVPATAAVVGNETFAAPNAQFVIPDTLVRAGMSWQVTRDPRARVSDDDPLNDVFPRDGPRAINAVSVPPMHIRFVRFTFNGVNSATATHDLFYLLMPRSVYPIDTLTSSQRAPNLSSAATPAEDYWSVMLAELDLARLLENTADPDAYWFGTVPPPVQGVTWPPDMQTGLAYVPIDPAGNGAGTRSAVGIAPGWLGFLGSPATNVAVAHEVGHWFGRQHAPCGPTVTAPDAGYPYTGGVTGVLGHNVAALARGLTPTATPQPPTTLDIMGPCNATRWVSDYTYRAVLEWRGYTTAPTAFQRAPIAPLTRSLIVRGRISAAGAVDLEPAFVTDARATRPERRGPYQLEVRDANGRVLVAEDFAPAVLSHARGGHFLFAIPISADVETAMASIEVRGPGSRAVRARPPAPSLIAMQRVAPNVRRLSAARTEVSCADPSAQGVMIRDADTGSLLGIARASIATLDLGAGQRVTISCSDGVSSQARTVIVR